MVDEEEAGQVVPADQGELLFQTLPDPGSDLAVAAAGGLVAQVLQVGLGGEARRDRMLGEVVSQVPGQVEVAPLGYMQGVPDGLGAALEQGRHLGGGLEVEVGVGPPLPVGLLQAPVVADGHQGVLEAVSLGDVVVDVVGGHRGHAHLVRQLVEAPDPLGVPRLCT